MRRRLEQPHVDGAYFRICEVVSIDVCFGCTRVRKSSLTYAELDCAMGRTIIPFTSTSASRLRFWRLGGCGQQALIYQHWRMPVMRVLLIVVGPANHFAVMPFARADFDAEG